MFFIVLVFLWNFWVILLLIEVLKKFYSLLLDNIQVFLLFYIKILCYQIKCKKVDLKYILLNTKFYISLLSIDLNWFFYVRDNFRVSSLIHSPSLSYYFIISISISVCLLRDIYLLCKSDVVSFYFPHRQTLLK